MKKWGIAVLWVVLIIGSVREVRAGAENCVEVEGVELCTVNTSGCMGEVGVYCDYVTNKATGATTYFETGTDNPLPVPGGYTEADIQTILDYQAAAGGGFEGAGTERTLGVEYAPGKRAFPLSRWARGEGQA